jgi:SAM-dependent methyltransferase
MESQEILEEYFECSDIEHFQRGKDENSRFWSRFNEIPSFEGAAVLDVGSGWGSLGVDMASAGAKKVVGLDIKCRLVDFANCYTKKICPHLAETIQFECLDLKHYDEQAVFDIIVSKDSFEHIIDLSGMIEEMKKRLKPGGKIYAGFGPLYTSPYGDHDRRRTILKSWGIFGQILALIPWLHLLIEPILVTMYNRYREKKITSIRDLQLNKFAWSDYREIFRKSGLNIVYLSKNNSVSMSSRLLSILAKLSFLEDLCIHNVYCILEKAVDQALILQ